MIRIPPKELRADVEQAMLGASAGGELVWVEAGRRRLLLVSGPDGAREVLVERAAELAKPRSQTIPLGRKSVAPPAGPVSPATLRRELSKGMGADRAEETAAELAVAVRESAAGWEDGATFALMPWLRPLVARAVVRGAFASDLSGDGFEQLARIAAWSGRTPRVARSGPTMHGLRRPLMLGRLLRLAQSVLANADLSRPSEVTALMDYDVRVRQALAGELLLGAVGPLAQEGGWTLFHLGSEPAPDDPEAFVREVTRLHPTNPLLVRVAMRETSVGGEAVPAGTVVVVNVAALHREPGVFPEPDRFLPERWLDGRTEEHRFSYAGFGIGERRCLGEAIAMRSLVAAVEAVAEWELSFTGGGVAAQGRRQLSDETLVSVRRARAS